MSGHQPSDGPESWAEHDETLQDHALPEPPAAARPWLLQQRFVHGLLRAMNTDAGAREQRVAAILESLPLRRRTPTRLLLAAALLLALVGWAVIPGFDRLPQAEAAVARAADELGKPIDRRFRLRIELAGRAAGLVNEITLTTRPGGSFLIEGVAVFGRFQAGSDGQQFWYRPGLPGSRVLTMPLPDADRMLGAMADVLDLGYLDVASLLRRLPSGFDLRAVGRESLEGLGPQIRVAAVALPQRVEDRLAKAELWFDERSGMVSRIELQGSSRSGVERTVRFDYVGVVELGPDGYSAPR